MANVYIQIWDLLWSSTVGEYLVDENVKISMLPRCHGIAVYMVDMLEYLGSPRACAHAKRSIAISEFGFKDCTKVQNV